MPTGKKPSLRDVMKADVSALPSTLDVKRIRALVLVLLAKQVEQKTLLTKLADCTEEIRKINEGTLPALLDEAGVPELVIDGMAIKTGTEYYPNVKVDVLPKFYAWLRSHKFAALIKNQLVVSFGMGEDEKAVLIAEQLLKKKLKVEKKQSVHPSTLKAWVKEQQEAKAPLPAMLDVNPVRYTTVKFKGVV